MKEKQTKPKANDKKLKALRMKISRFLMKELVSDESVHAMGVVLSEITSGLAVSHGLSEEQLVDIMRSAFAYYSKIVDYELGAKKKSGATQPGPTEKQ